MKIRILDRILVALAGLLMLAGGAALTAQLFFGKNVAGRVASWLADESLRVYIIIAGILLFLLGVYCVLLLFRRKGRNGKFIMQRTENGELAISLKALETMVQKCLDQHKEVSAQAVSLENQKGSLMIRIRGTVAGGVSIPLTVETMQQQIKQYVTACSGVEVRDIRVEIESSGPDAKDAPFAIEAPAAIGLLKGASEPAPAQEEKEEKKPAEKAETAAAPEMKAAAENTTQTAENKQTESELAAAAAAAALLMDKVPEEEDDRPMHQRLFSTVEEPCVMPMPPVNLEETNREEKQEEERPEPETASEANKDEGSGTEEIKAEDLKTEEPKTEEPKAEASGTGEPTDENRKTEEPAAGEAGAEGPKTGETGTDGKKKEEPGSGKARNNWFRNKKNKTRDNRNEGITNEGSNPDKTAAADETSAKEAAKTGEEAGGAED